MAPSIVDMSSKVQLQHKSCRISGADNHYANILANADLSPSRLYYVRGYNIPKNHIPQTFIQPLKLMLA